MAYKDTRKESKTLEKLTGGGMDDVLIRGAYMSARADSPDYGWLDAIGSGVKTYKAEYDAKKALEKTSRDKAFGDIQNIVDGIYANSGSLDKEYFDYAYDHTEELRNKYADAVAAGDNKLQLQLKGELNAFGASVKTLSTDISDSAGLWKDGALVKEEGMTNTQLSINKSINSKNVVGDKGVYKWKAVDHLGNPMFEEDGSRKYYTMEDLKGALPLRDDVGKETHLKHNESIREKSQKYRDGEGGSPFDVKANRDANMKLLENDEYLQSWIWDDQTGYGSFEASLEEHPEFKDIFDAINTNEDNLSNTLAIGMYDKKNIYDETTGKLIGDGVVDFRDFIEFGTPESKVFYSKEFDKDQNGIISVKELELIKKDPDALKAIQEIARGKLKEAITNTDKNENPRFNADLTKRLIADFLTNRQRIMFYGDKTEPVVVGVDKNGENIMKDIPTYQMLVPNAENSNYEVKLGRKSSRGWKYFHNKNEGSLWVNEVEITSPEQYVEAGGNWGYLHDQGYIYDKKAKPPVFKYVKKDPLITLGPKY